MLDAYVGHFYSRKEKKFSLFYKTIILPKQYTTDPECIFLLNIESVEVWLSYN